MKKGKIRAVAATLATISALSFTSCNLKLKSKDINNNIEILNIEELVIEESNNATIIEEPIVNEPIIVTPEPTIAPTATPTPTPTPEPTPTPVVENWYDINAYHYLTKNAYLFRDESFNNPGTLIENYEKVYVIKSNDDWAYVMTDNGEYGYMEPYLLHRLPDVVFVEVDISNQTTKLYENHQEIFSTPNVTGKDSTPSDVGYFDIDQKATDTYLRSYLPNGTLEYETFVKYWIPYNGGEGLHDAPWQEGHFGDTEYYHWGGSHGCINLPEDAVVIIYVYVNVGTMVLVHK